MVVEKRIRGHGGDGPGSVPESLLFSDSSKVTCTIPSTPAKVVRNRFPLVSAVFNPPVICAGPGEARPEGAAPWEKKAGV